MEHIGIDVHKKTSQVCIQTSDGQLVERRLATTREALTKLFADRKRAKVLMEASTDSEWVARWLEELGHEVIVADPNFAPMYSTRSRKVKTDRRDAQALCDACRLGAYRPAHYLKLLPREIEARASGTSLSCTYSMRREAT